MIYYLTGSFWLLHSEYTVRTSISVHDTIAYKKLNLTQKITIKAEIHTYTHTQVPLRGHDP